jgi:hypothetical protein
VQPGKVATSGFRAARFYPMNRDVFENYNLDAAEESSPNEGVLLSHREDTAHTFPTCTFRYKVTASSFHMSTSDSTSKS